MRFLFVFIFSFSVLFAIDVKLDTTKIANGKTALLEVKKQKGVEYKKVLFCKREYPLYQHPKDKTKLFALLPVSYYEKPSTKDVKIIYKKGSKLLKKVVHLKVVDGKYKKEKIKVSASKVNPKSKKVLKRTAREYKEAMKIYNTFSDKSYIQTDFILPLKSVITSDFGKARVYNNRLKGYHSGTDFRAKTPTPIVASNDGVVVLAKDRFYAGGSIIINHGHGIYTCYYHLSKFLVKKNQRVKKGDVIALSGATGRVTGPHLHFSIRVNGIQVDPLQLIALLNEKIL